MWIKVFNQIEYIEWWKSEWDTHTESQLTINIKWNEKEKYAHCWYSYIETECVELISGVIDIGLNWVNLNMNKNVRICINWCRPEDEKCSDTKNIKMRRNIFSSMNFRCSRDHQFYVNRLQITRFWDIKFP